MPLLIPRCRDRDPGGPLRKLERSRSWNPTVAVPWKESRRFSNYSPFRKPPLLWFCNTSRTATGLTLGLRFLQHCEHCDDPTLEIIELQQTRHDSLENTVRPNRREATPDFASKFDWLTQPMVRYLTAVRFLRSLPTSKPRAAYPGSLFRCIRASTGLLAST